jgi:hypothetical protein
MKTNAKKENLMALESITFIIFFQIFWAVKPYFGHVQMEGDRISCSINSRKERTSLREVSIKTQ